MKKMHCLWHTTHERNIGYLLFRLFVGVALLTHGWPKLTGGAEVWRGLGGIMGSLGIPGPAVFWGFMAAFAEGIGAILLIVGLATPLVSFLILITMLVAVFGAHAGDAFQVRELALMYLFASLLFMLKGAGAYSLDRFLPHRRANR